MNKMLALSAAFAFAGMSFTVSAASNEELLGGFVRVEGGRTDADIKISGFGSGCDHDNAYSVRGGYWYNGHFALEAFYTNAFDKRYTDGVDTIGLKATALGGGIVGKKNFGDIAHQGAYIMGRLGVMHGKLEGSVSGLGSDSASSTEAYFGIGAGYDFTQNFGISLNYDYLKGSNDGVKVTAKPLMLGAEFRF